jgi:hypothetical protein
MPKAPSSKKTKQQKQQHGGAYGAVCLLCRLKKTHEEQRTTIVDLLHTFRKGAAVFVSVPYAQ